VAYVTFGTPGAGPAGAAGGAPKVADQPGQYGALRASLEKKSQQELVNIVASKNLLVPKERHEFSVALQVIGQRVKDQMRGSTFSSAGRDFLKSAAVQLQGHPKAGHVLAALQEHVKV
jgi:hypothetical protein